MKMIRVVAAVICDDIQTKHKIYATARGYGEYKGCLLYTSDAADD